MFGSFHVIFPEGGGSFRSSFQCFSVSMLPGNERQDVEKGGKIIMPPSVLDQLTRLNVDYPMLFKLTNKKNNRISHAGVLEFVADEGKVYLPYWMMHNLLLGEGEILQVENVSLPIATYSKFQPQSSDFLDITNPKAVLENALRNFACLTTGDLIAIKYNQKIYELCVLETKPGNAVSIIECDMNVEFEAPVGYKELNSECKVSDIESDFNVEHSDTSDIFYGEGIRLDGKKKKDITNERYNSKQLFLRGTPDYTHKYGTIHFDRVIKSVCNTNGKMLQEREKITDTFQGQGFSLKKGKK